MYEYETRKLNFQLVPRTSWYTNVRSMFPNWSEISHKVRGIGRCEICGCQTRLLDAHEVWDYDDRAHKQNLNRIISVCKACHQTIHIGLAQVQGKSKAAIAQYMAVNGLSELEAEHDLSEAMQVWQARSCHSWTIDEQQVRDRVAEQTGIECATDLFADGRYYAAVAYEEKEEAKKYGAKWDADRKMWYLPDFESRHRWSNSSLIPTQARRY